MKDVQSQKDSRNIRIERVGVKNLRIPIKILDRANETQNTVASVDVTVSLPAEQRATHMSRFLEVLWRHREPLTLKEIPPILDDIRKNLGAEKADITYRFPYFIERRAPVSGALGTNEYICTFFGEVNDRVDLILGIDVPVHSFCPCSKAISDRGGHNQRGVVRLKVRFGEFIWIEELVEIVESSASAPLFPVLKREDEKYLSELAYDNPVFVEDIVRNVSVKLLERAEVVWFSVEAENMESIHNHEAFAQTEFDKREKIRIV
ncbi:MAG: GTP cyclohydrolase FolE2 [Myxococcota bacterium]